jgi:hypothetical protein
VGLASVDVALARRVGGGSCRWWDGRRFAAAARSCSAPEWVRARGTDLWSVRVRLPRRGSFVALSRASQRGGLVEAKRSWRNTRSFRLR